MLLIVIYENKLQVIIQQKNHINQSQQQFTSSIINRTCFPPLLVNKFYNGDGGVNIVRNYSRKPKSIMNYTFTLLQLPGVHAEKKVTN